MTTHSRRRLGILAAAVLIAGAAGAGAYALWSGVDATPGATIRSGTLAVEAADPVWVETSADVAASPHEIDPDTFLVRQGDTLEARYALETELDGDNMVAEFAVDWPDQAPSLPAGVTATYMLFADDGTPTGTPLMGAPAAVGTPAVLLPGARLVAGTAVDQFEIVISFDFAGLDDRFGADSAPQVSSLGTVTVTLEQTREGDGFQ